MNRYETCNRILNAFINYKMVKLRERTSDLV